MTNKSPINWKGGFRALAYFLAIYCAFIYFMFFNEPADGWKGVLHNLKYPAAIVAPVFFALVTYQTFKGKR